jgi:hypothetical protein
MKVFALALAAALALLNLGVPERAPRFTLSDADGW